MRYLLLLILITTTAQASTLKCEFYESQQVVWEETFDVPNLGLYQLYNHGVFQYKVNHKGGFLYEVEVLDTRVPARYFVQSVLNTPESILSWSIWSRHEYLELSCKRI